MKLTTLDRVAIDTVARIEEMRSELPNKTLLWRKVKGIRKQFLKRYALVTVRRYFTSIRKELKLCGQFDESEKRMLFKIFAIPEKSLNRINDTYKNRIQLANERGERTPLNARDEYIQTAVEYINSASYLKIGLGLMILTGRRTVEIFQTATFERINKNTVLFVGQAKKRGDAIPYKIPTLVRATDIVKALEKLRSLKSFDGCTTEYVNQTVGSRLKKEMLFLVRFLGVGCVPHDTRKAYAAITASEFKPPKMSFRVFIGKVLGHSEKDDLAKESYMKYLDTTI